MQARVGAGGKLLDVKTETVALAAPSSDNPRVREALAAVNVARRKLAEADRRVANNAAALKLIESIAAKVASDAAQSLGSALDPEKLRAQIVFIQSARDRLTTESLILSESRTRAAGTLAIAFDAVVRQATGEDWTDVSLVLSTEQPTRASNPREIAPMYVDAFDPSSPVPVAWKTRTTWPDGTILFGDAD